MLNLKKLAVTGNLSCGKSSVCRILKELGAYVISADNIVHQLLSPETNLGREVIQLLGPHILVNNKIDRSIISQIVFFEPQLLQALEKIIHPAVYKEIESDYQKQQNIEHPPKLFVAEIPLLFESGGEKNYDFTLAVVADPKLCLKRFLEKTKYDQQEFELRNARQLPGLSKASRADYVIMNSGSLESLQEKTMELYQELCQMSL